MENEKLSHLTSDRVEQLMARYYSGERAADLIDEFQIKIPVSKLTSVFPPIVHEETCPYCKNIRLISQRPSKTAYRSSSPFCPHCEHKTESFCFCVSCKELRQTLKDQEQDLKETLIESTYGYTKPIPLISELSLRDVTYLLAIINHSTDEELWEVFPYSTSGTIPPLAPTYDLTNNVVEHLRERGFISIGTYSPVEAFNFDSKIERVESYYPSKISWELFPYMRIEEKIKYLRAIEDILKSFETWPEEWLEEVLPLRLEVSKYECIQYFVYLLDQRRFKLDSLGEKTHSVFESLLQDFSVSQIFNLTWQAVRDVTDYTVKEGIPKSHGKNIFIGSIQRKADRAKVENWDVKKARRDYNCPQTILSSILFNKIIRIGDKGFNNSLTESSSDRME